MRMPLSDVRWVWYVLAALSLSPFCIPRQADAQNDVLVELSDEEQRQVQIAERFLTVIEKSPRRGTALDRVYGHHVEFGTLDDFLESLRQRVEENPDDGAGWMLLGLFESQRGEDGAAIDAFKKAEEHRPDDPLASYYLGQSQLLLGQPEQAVEAFERAIDRKPQRTDLLEIFQQLGRVHQRAQRDEEALAVWTRLEGLFPDDPRVQEQIAVTLVEEGEYALALPRYEKLAELVEDDYRRTMFQLEAAELKVREGQKDAGVADLERVLANLNPDSWLHREVRRRIEDVFLRSGDQDGLVTYYEKWIGSHSEDVDAMARAATFLARSARMPEAMQWMEKALKLAPSRFELRKAFIDQLVDDQRYADAIGQYKLLAESDPGNPDVLREWGKLTLKDKSQPIEARQAAATGIWDQIIANRPDDALTAAQVADLYRQANMNDAAIRLYEKAVALAPGDPQYREYLGEFFHILKRPDDALATWKEIAAGERHTAENVARLAEVYNSFGYLGDSIEQIAEACRLEPKDFALQLRSADYHSRAEKYDEALAYVKSADELAANAEERDAVITQRIDVLQSSRQLEDESDALAARLTSATDATSDDWHLLARYYEAERRWANAIEAIDKAIAIDGQSIPALTTAARIAESSGDLGKAAELSRSLADVDRRSRGDHLMNVARLEAQMGRTDEALQAGQDLIVTAPGNTDNYEFYAQLCFQLGRMDEGLDTLRKAVRINPTEPSLIMSLASALSRQFRTDEAIEVYWRAFEKTDDVEEKTSLTQKLTELYLQINQFDKLIDRFERDRREEDQRRDMTICLAQAHHSAGDYGTARMELESLLSENTRDTNLLQQISKLCEEGSDLEAAIEYQRQLAAVAPGHETEFRLAGLLQRAGLSDEASEIFVRLTRREEDPVRLMRSLDSLLSQGSYESVLAVVDPLLSEQRDDWELMYRQAVAWASLDKQAEAEDVVRRILALNVPFDAYGRAAEEKYKRELAKAKSNSLRGIQSSKPQRTSPLQMLGNASQVRQAVGLDAERSYYSGSMSMPRVWTPDVYGVARMAAFGWLMAFEQSGSHDAEQEGSFIDEIAQRAAAEDAPREAIYDWMFVEQLRDNYDSLFDVARRLSREGGKEEQTYFLQSLMTRGTNLQSTRQRSGNEPPKAEPLGDDDLDLMLACYESLSRQNEDDADARRPGIAGAQLAYGSNGQVYVNIGGQYVLISSGGYVGSAFLGQVVKELELAGREEKAQELVEKQIADAESAGELSGVIQLLVSREEEHPQPERIRALYDRWVAAAKEEIDDPPQAANQRGRNQSSVNDPLAANSQMIIGWFGKLGPEEEHEQMLAILNPALDLAVEVGKARRAERSTKRRRSSTGSQRSGQWGMQWQYGKNTQYVRVEYPQPNDYVTQPQLMLLRAAYEIFNRNDVAEDVISALRRRVEQADADDRLYEQLMLAYVLWWAEQQDEALEILTAASEQLADDPEFRLELAGLHQSRGDLDTAMDLVEAIAPRDQKLMQQREMTAMSLAERLGEVDRARQAAERLFGLRLSTEEQLNLATAMRRLGLADMAESVLSRAERRAGNQASALPLLMAQYQGQGKIDLAQQIAHRILQTTQSPLSAMNTTGRNPLRYNSNANQDREQALRVLQQTGGLTPMIERLEEQVAASPNSPRLYEQLVELYQVTGDRDKLAATLTKAVEARPEAAALQLQLAKHYEQTGKPNEACDAYLAVLKQKPQWIADDLYQIRQQFERAKRSLELAKAFDDVPLQQLGHPYYLIQIVSDLMQDEQNVDLAAGMFERIVDAFPSYRNQMLSNIRDHKVWKNDKVYELGKRLVIPSEVEVKQSPWAGIDQIYSYSGNGTVNAMFHQMRDGVAEAGRMDDFRQTISDAVDKQPGWYGGKTMLALIDLKQGKQDAARDQLQALVSDPDIVKSMPRDACWLVGQELDGFQETRSLALALFEQGMTAQSSGGINQLQYSPMVKLVKLYSDTGRKADARDLLLKQLKAKLSNSYNQEYEQAMAVQNGLWAAGQFRDLGFPLESLKLYQELSAIEDGNLEYASQWVGGSVDQLKQQMTTGLTKSLEAVGQSDPDEAVAELLVVPEKRKPGEPVFDLMLSLPSLDAEPDANPRASETKEMSSRFVKLLDSIADSESMRDSVQKRLQTLHSDFDGDYSIVIAQALIAPDGRRQAAVAELVDTLKQHPLDEIAQGRRPNARQRRQALNVVPVWLVARECLAEENLKESGELLAEEALQAARRQIGHKHASIVLMEWGKAALDAGDKAEAERRWSQLLDVVTERPTRKKPAPADRRSSAIDRGMREAGSAMRGRLIVGRLSESSRHGHSPPLANRHDSESRATEQTPTSFVYFADDKPAAAAVVPPLTVSQFKIARTIATEAAIHGMPELSRRAVKEMLAGGMPVPDVETNAQSVGGMAGGMMMRSGRGAVSTGNSDMEQLVADALLAIVGHWQGPDYPPADVYELLRPIVLPAARPNEIMLFADSSKLDEGRVTDAGQVVIEWAAKAGQLDELTEQVAERQQNPQAQVAGLVMLTNIAMQRDDLDASRRHLDALAKRLAEQTNEASATLACHAALPASDRPPLKEPAFAILQQAVKLRAQAAAADRNNTSSIGALHRTINHYLAEQGKTQEITAFFDDYVNSRQSYYARYSGDYGLYQQWQDWAVIANEAAQVGAVDTALDFIGRTVDFEHSRYSRPSIDEAFVGVLRRMESLPAQQRYETWRDWTLPTDTRRNVRVVVANAAKNTTPAEFLPDEQKESRFPQEDLLSNLLELLEAAEETGRLDEIRELAGKAYEEEVPNAEYLWPLVMLRQKDAQAATSVVTKLVDRLKERHKPQDGQQRPDIAPDYLVYWATLQSPEVVSSDLFDRIKLRDQLRTRSGLDWLARLDRDFARARSKQTNASLRPGDDPGLTYWTPATTLRVPHTGGQAWWDVYEEQLMHLGGSNNDSLYFNAPLTGDFEFSLDCVSNGWSEADIGYNAVVVNALDAMSQVAVEAVDEHEQIRRPQPLQRVRPAVDHAALKVSGTTMSYWLNNQLVYEEELSGTSPWLHLSTDKGRQVAVFNLKLTGTPDVPEQVLLVSGDRMDGWNTHFFNESQPRRRTMKEVLTDTLDYRTRYAQEHEPLVHDWSAKGSVLAGRADPSAAADAQSWIFYHRPLAEGETFAYEFEYQPGTAVASPTLGRVAYRLTPDGVTTHWIADANWDAGVLGIPIDNEHVPTDARRGPDALPLIPDDWNRVTTSLEGGVVRITLNDTLVYEGPAVVDPDTRFGLYRPRRQEARVRDVSLSGPWREQFASLADADLLARKQPLDAASRRIIGEVVDDEYSALIAPTISQRARKLPDDEAYTLLSDWVLPSADHSAVRLDYQRTPYEQAFATTSENEERPAAIDVGALASPAVDLVNLAVRTDRLNELFQAVAAVETPDLAQQRAKLALETLLMIARQDDDGADETLRQIDAILAGEMEYEARKNFIAPEIVAARAAANRPTLAVAADQIIRRLVEASRRPEQSFAWTYEAAATWGSVLERLAGDGRRSQESLTQREIRDNPGVQAGAGEGGRLTQWHNVPYLRPEYAYAGMRHTHWRYERGRVESLPSLAWGQLYFQSPLQGRFEIIARRSLFGYREAAISYGIHAAAPRYDGQAITLTTAMHAHQDVTPIPELPPLGSDAEFRIVVDGNTVTTFVEGVKLYEKTMDAPPAPWLMLRQQAIVSRSEIRNLRILGEPVIPDELDLLNTSGAGFWRADYYHSRFSSDGTDENAPWRRTGDELLGSLQTDRSAAYLENLLFYQRPMLEDGEITFETFYVPGEIETHPALGRSAFLLRPDGVALHELTDAEYERRGRASDNASPIPGAAASVPLNENDWNQVTLSLHGDEVTISVNGAEVARHTVTEPRVERFFGLFRWSNKTRTRVRNITWRGDWPKTLPPVEEQQLAYPAEGALHLADDDWTSVESLDLSQPLDHIASSAFRLSNAAACAESVDDGLHLWIDHSQQPRLQPGIEFSQPIEGDGEIAVDFERLQLTPVAAGWGVGLSLKFHFDGDSRWVELGQALDSAGQPKLKVGYRQQLLTGKSKHEGVHENVSYASGRLRLVRLGGVVYGLFAEQGSPQFRYVGRAEVGTAPIRRVEVSLLSSDEQGTVDVVLTGLSVKYGRPDPSSRE